MSESRKQEIEKEFINTYIKTVNETKAQIGSIMYEATAGRSVIERMPAGPLKDLCTRLVDLVDEYERLSK